AATATRATARRWVSRRATATAPRTATAAQAIQRPQRPTASDIDLSPTWSGRCAGAALSGKVPPQGRSVARALRLPDEGERATQRTSAPPEKWVASTAPRLQIHWKVCVPLPPPLTPMLATITDPVNVAEALPLN